MTGVLNTLEQCEVMGFLTYNLRWRTQQINEDISSTGACYGDIEAVIKRDTPGAPA